MNSGPIRGQLPRRQNHYLRNNQNYNSENRNSNVLIEKSVDTDDVTSVEKRPKVNPIFLWVLQREQRIVEVRCEDYDKRNRIKLTKTARGWKSIPRTSSNVYNSCFCVGTNHNDSHDGQNFLKDSSPSPSVSSTCVPCSISSKSVSSSPLPASLLSSSSSELNISEPSMNSKRVTRNKQILLENKNKLVNKRRCRRRKKRRKQRDRLRYEMSGDEEESDYQSSLCRKSIDLSSEFDPNTVYDANENNNNISDKIKTNDYDEYEFHDTEDENIINYEKRPFRLIDLEKAKNDQLLQPRVVLEPLNPSRIRLYSSASEHFKLDDEIEMITESDNENVDKTNEIVGVNDEDVDDDDIEEIDDIEELEEDNPTVFEYDDRDSVDMMNEEDQKSVPDDAKTLEDLPADDEYIENDVKEVEVEDDVTILKEKIVSFNQVPDLKPIKEVNNDTRTLPSPPCSVTCSEDARNFGGNPEKKPESPPIKRRREAPDLIEVKPTEWRRRELMKPSNQLKELIETSGGLLPDPLLVPRDRLAVLAACPGIEIPRLLITRPELRLPKALSNPQLLSDPNILVISLSHLLQVLEAAELKSREERDKNILPVPSTPVDTSLNGFNSGTNSERKRLSCKPIGSLMPAPMDLSKSSNINSGNSILRVKNGLYKQEAEVTSTGDDSRFWHPLFSSRDRNDKRPKVQTQERLMNQYQQSYQEIESNNHHSWHRTTLAS